METAVFIVMLTLLLIHEMDAIRAKEWKMFIVLKNLEDELAYRIFTLAHIPIYFFVLFVLVRVEMPAIAPFKYSVDIFLIIHAVIHYCFRKKPNNGFRSLFSITIIYSLSILAIIHICFVLFCCIIRSVK